MIELRKLSVAVLIVMLIFGFGFAPVNPQTTNYFSVIKVYWGTEEPIEVSPGDTATLSVVLRYEYQYSAKSLKAELSLPEGFKAVGGEQRALAYYASTISIGSIITLDFSIFIKGASKGSYLTHLQLNYYIADRSQWFNELLDVSFEVTGKPSLNVTSLNDSLNEGNQQVRILIQNEGDAVAESLKIVRVYSSSAPTEIKGGTVLGRLEPGSQVTVPVYVYVSSSLKGGLLTLTVETTCKGPNGVVYSFSKNLLIPVGVGKSVVLGRVIGEEREGISNVEIEVYSSDGAYVGNINNIGYITSDGHFAVSLTLGSYVLHFSKEGYAKVTKSISLKSGGEIIDLGDVTLLKALRLSSSILSLSASPGDKLLLPFSISNICDESETVDFKVSKPMGWSTKILGQVGNEVKRIQFSSSGSLSFQLEVMVPISALGSNSLILTAVGKTNSTLNFTIDVEAFQSVISCQFPGKASTPGDVVRFQVRLTNPLGVKTAFMVSVDNIPKNWTVSVKNTGGESLTQATLDRSEFADLVVEATSPDTAKIGEQYTLLLKVKSYDGNLLEYLPLGITLAKVEEEVKIAVASRQVSAEAGKILGFPVTIMNTGSVDRLVLLSVEPPANWKVVFKYTTTGGTTMEVSGLYVEAKKSASLVIEATPPSTVGIGTYTIPVRVSSEKGVVYSEINLKSTITGAYALSLTPSTLLTSVSIGSSTTLTTRITNTGQTPVTSLGLTVSGAPTGWDVSITPVRVESLKAGESYTFTVTVKTTADTVAGDYLITFTGSSDQVKSDGVQVRLTATVSTSWGLIGVGMAAVMVIALIVVFMKFRRR